MRYTVDGNAFFERIVAGDETRCHLWEPELKALTMQWYHPSSPSPKKFKSQSSAEKVILTLFFYFQGPLLLDFKDPGVSVTGEQYNELLERVQHAINAK